MVMGLNHSYCMMLGSIYFIDNLHWTSLTSDKIQSIIYWNFLPCYIKIVFSKPRNCNHVVSNNIIKAHTIDPNAVTVLYCVMKIPVNSHKIILDSSTWPSAKFESLIVVDKYLYNAHAVWYSLFCFVFGIRFLCLTWFYLRRTWVLIRGTRRHLPPEYFWISICVWPWLAISQWSHYAVCRNKKESFLRLTILCEGL